MTGSVNFNPFLKNIQYVDLEQYAEIQEKKASPEYGMNGDSQDEENVEIRLMSSNTESNYNAAKNSGMKSEVPNDIRALKEELDKYIQIFTKNYPKQNPSIGSRELEKVIGQVDNEFLDKYLREIQGDKTIVMSDVVQEFEQFVEQKAASGTGERNIANAMVQREKDELNQKYDELYGLSRGSKSSHSQNGRDISWQEEAMIKSTASEYVTQQFLMGDDSFLKQINPDSINSSNYKKAQGLLESYNSTDDNDQKTRYMLQIRNELSPLINAVNTEKMVFMIGRGAGAPEGAERPNFGGHGHNNDYGSNSNVGNKFEDLYNAAQKATSWYSRGGSRVTGRESEQIKDKTADLLISQMLNGQGSLGLLKSLIPDYKKHPEYRAAAKLLSGIEYADNPRDVKQIMKQAKECMMELLNHTSGADIADVVENGRMDRYKNNYAQWGNEFKHGCEMNKNQHTLFNAADETDVADKEILPKSAWGGITDYSITQAVDYMENYYNNLKDQLESTVSSRSEYNQICRALDKAASEFDIRQYLQDNSKGFSAVSLKDMATAVLKDAQALLGNNSRFDDIKEDGADPYNRDLMKSKFLVQHSGNRIDKQEKSEISESYAKYMIKALAADPSNVSLLDSLKGGSFFDSSSFDFVSVEKVMKELKDLIQNPPASRKKFNQQMEKITKELEFLINKMDTSTLVGQVIQQGASW